MATDTSTISGLMKRVYGKVLDRQQNLKHRTIDEVGKSSKKYSPDGEGFFGGINTYGNEAGGAQTESEAFRTIDNENYEQYKVSPKINIWPIEFTGLSAASANRDEAAFARSVADALTMSKERLLSDENRQFFGDGQGSLAIPAGAVASDVTSFSVDSTQYLRKNQVVDIYNGATLTVDSKRITRVDHQSKVIHFATSLGAVLTATAEIVKENIRTSAPTDGKEMMGLRGIVDDGTDLSTFQNLDASSIDIWNSIRIDASSANLTSDLLQRLIDDVEIFGGEEVDLLLTHPKQRRKYLDLVVPQKRYADMKLDAGHSEVSFNGKRMLLDKDCQADVIYAVKRSRLHKYEIKPVEMGGYDGSDKFLRTSGKDVFQAYWRHYANFGTAKRNSMGKIVSLAEGNGLS